MLSFPPGSITLVTKVAFNIPGASDASGMRTGTEAFPLESSLVLNNSISIE